MATATSDMRKHLDWLLEAEGDQALEAVDAVADRGSPASAEPPAAARAGLELVGLAPAVEGPSPTASPASSASPAPSAASPMGSPVEAARRIRASQPVDELDRARVEAIVLPGLRPVIDIIDGSFAAPHGLFADFDKTAPRAHIESAIPSVGRIDLPDRPDIAYGGTGFVVGDGLLMTNRHVAELFAQGLGREGLSFRTGQRATIDFLRERDREPGLTFQVERIAMIHPYWDMALLTVSGLGGLQPLELTAEPPEAMNQRPIAVIGYPAFDPRNDVVQQNQIFGGVFNVKRLQPGRIRSRREVHSFGNTVNAVTHDSSTLGGNSGSLILDVETGKVVGLHFAGAYLDANFAVPSHELALDRRIVDAGVYFDDQVAGAATSWDRLWRVADPGTEHATRPSPTGDPDAPAAEVTMMLPLEITVRLGTATATAAVASTRLGGDGLAVGTEAAVEPFHEVNLADRNGYDSSFLDTPVPLPIPLDPSVVSTLADGVETELRYEHFSILMHRERRLAIVAAANVDASPHRKEPEPGRDYTRRGLTGLREGDREKWFTDPRIPAVHQLPDKFYTKDRTAFDKGHVVRRDDPAWGLDYDEVRRANGDTYHVTNCSPQVSDFNRKVWLRLENLILREARDERLTVFTGPVFACDDPLFEGVADEGPVTVPIPRRYWKVAVASVPEGLASFGFLLEQDLTGVQFEDDREFAVSEEWRAAMVPIPELGEMVDLDFGAIVDADQFGAEAAVRVSEGAGILTGSI